MSRVAFDSSRSRFDPSTSVFGYSQDSCQLDHFSSLLFSMKEVRCGKGAHHKLNKLLNEAYANALSCWIHFGHTAHTHAQGGLKLCLHVQLHSWRCMPNSAALVCFSLHLMMCIGKNYLPVWRGGKQLGPEQPPIYKLMGQHFVQKGWLQSWASPGRTDVATAEILIVHIRDLRPAKT